jgi:hypothetical protein
MILEIYQIVLENKATARRADLSGWKLDLHGEKHVVLAEQFKEYGEKVGAEEPRHVQSHVLL